MPVKIGTQLTPHRKGTAPKNLPFEFLFYIIFLYCEAQQSKLPDIDVSGKGLNMSFVEATKTCLRKYFVFSGRATRPEYWWFVLFAVLLSVLLAIIDALLFGRDTATGESTQILTPIFQLAIVVPMLAAGWRRLHDTGRPGWYLVLPAALSIATMVMLFGGIAVFSVLEQRVDDPEALTGPAALLGLTGLTVVWILQVILSILMIWWLSRPSQEGTNEYGPPAV